MPPTSCAHLSRPSAVTRSCSGEARTPGRRILPRPCGGSKRRPAVWRCWWMVGGEDVVLSVTARGPGFPPEIAGRVLELFYVGDAARSRKTGGAGLGLSMVSAIVEANGGGVTATSADGSGATFEVRLPV